MKTHEKGTRNIWKTVGGSLWGRKVFAPAANKAQVSVRKILITCVLFALLTSISVSTVSAQAPSCDTYSTENNCVDNGCKWCDECSSNEQNTWGAGTCVDTGTSCGYSCVYGECGADCTANEGCDTVDCRHLDGCYPDNGGEINVACESLSNLCINCQCENPECPSDPAAVCAHVGTDSDGDGFDDACETCDDEPALQEPDETPEATCDDGVDNDCDGLTDCEDPDCDDFDTGISCGDQQYDCCDGTILCDSTNSANNYLTCSTEGDDCIIDCRDACNIDSSVGGDDNSYTYDFASAILGACQDTGECNSATCDYSHYCADADDTDDYPNIPTLGYWVSCNAECDEPGEADCPSYCDSNIYYSGDCNWDASQTPTQGEICGCFYVETDCNAQTGWSDTGQTQWVDDTECTEKQQKEQEYLECTCQLSEPHCDCSITDTRWVDVDPPSTRNKQDGTLCGQPRNCPDDQCIDPFYVYYPADGHDTCQDGVCVQYLCDEEDRECDEACGAECDENQDCDDSQCDGTSYQTRTGTCDDQDCMCDYDSWQDESCADSVIECAAECDDDTDCAPSCSGDDYYLGVCDTTPGACSCTDVFEESCDDDYYWCNKEIYTLHDEYCTLNGCDSDDIPQQTCDDDYYFCSGDEKWWHDEFCTQTGCDFGETFSYDCNDDDCTTGLACVGVGTDEIEEYGDDYTCITDDCATSSTTSCDGPWMCTPNTECTRQDCGTGTYLCYNPNDVPTDDWTWASGAEATETNCGDGFDNDCDGYVDCEDTDCQSILEVTATPAAVIGNDFDFTVVSGQCIESDGTYQTTKQFTCCKGAQVEIDNPTQYIGQYFFKQYNVDGTVDSTHPAQVTLNPTYHNVTLVYRLDDECPNVEVINPADTNPVTWYSGLIKVQATVSDPIPSSGLKNVTVGFHDLTHTWEDGYFEMAYNASSTFFEYKWDTAVAQPNLCSIVQVDVFGEDNVGNKCGDVNQFGIDNVPPVTEKIIGEPKFGSEGAYVTTSTPFTLNATDCGSQTDYIHYEIWADTDCDQVPDTKIVEQEVDGSLAEFRFPQESCHILKWWAIDNNGNQEEEHTQFHMVEDQPPETNLTLTGPVYEAGGKVYVDGVTKVVLNCTDPNPHPSGVDELLYRYKVDNGEFTQWMYYDVPFSFPEESMHTLEYYCVDNLDNTEDIKSTVFYVDHTPPETNKTEGDPFYTNGVSKWITTATPITLTADDGNEIHDSGVAATYYRVRVLNNPMNWMYCEAMCGQWTGTPQYLESFNPTPWQTYSTSFNVSEESCHIIEYYSVDHVNKTEQMKWQCLFVQETDPYVIKNITGPQVDGDGDMVDGEYIHKYLTDESTITLQCIEAGEHPTGEVTLYWSMEWKLNEGDTWQGVSRGIEEEGVKRFTGLNDSYHRFTYWCEDALGNAGDIQTEVDVVDNQAPETVKTVSMPKIPSQQSFDYFITRDTVITLNCTDKMPHPVGDVTLYWELGWAQECDGDFQGIDDGVEEDGYVELVGLNDSCHALKWYCVDALGNQEDMRDEMDVVDNKPPVSTKEVGEPKVPYCEPETVTETVFSQDVFDVTVTKSCEDGNIKWVIDLEGIDGHWHTGAQLVINEGASPVFLVGWSSENTQAPVTKTYNGGWSAPSTALPAGVTVSGVYNDTHYEIIIPSSMLNGGDFSWAINTEASWPGHSSAVQQQYPANWGRWSAPEDNMDQSTVKDYYLTDQTPITITCADQMPHPVDNVTIYYRQRWKKYLTQQWEDNWTAWVGVNDVETTLYKTEDSVHQLEWYCVDQLGNEEEHGFEIDIVDTQGPQTSLDIVGPTYYNASEDKLFVDGVTQITLTCEDLMPHPVGGEQIYWRYKVDEGNFGEWMEYSEGIRFPEESMHTMQYYCEDALGNTEQTQTKVVYVDHTPPETNKTEGDPFYTDGVSKWITTATPITLTADDGDEIHDSGVAETYWRNYRITDPEIYPLICGRGGSTTKLDDPKIDGGDLNGMNFCHPEFYRQHVDENKSWEVYDGPFTKDNESCHIIEYYSVDNVNKTERMKWQCVYVEDTAPTIYKDLTGPVQNCTEQEAIAYGSPDYGCHYITNQTLISLECFDEGDHPVDNVTLFWRFYLMNETAPDYNVEYDGNTEFTSPQDSEHKLEFYCVDALGNTQGNATHPHVEIDVVDTQAPITNKTVSDPKVMGQQGIDYFITRATDINLTCVDPMPHPVDNVTLYYAVYYSEECIDPVSEGWQLIDSNQTGGFAHITGLNDSCHKVSYFCVDALGNTEAENMEVDAVDNQAPTGTKAVGTPKLPMADVRDLGGYTDTYDLAVGGNGFPTGTVATTWGNEGVEWEINVDGDYTHTEFQLIIGEDSDGPAQYHVGWLGGSTLGMKEYNGGWGPETQLPAGVDVTGTPGDEVFTVFIPYSLLNDGSFGWSVNVGARNSGGTKFSQYPVDWVRWAGTGVYEGTPVRDWWVMDHVTEITLDCEDKLPHPSEVKQMCYKISFDNDTTPWLTDQYCGDFGGEMKGDECCVDPQGLPYTFNFTEDSLHDLYWRCEDRLGNMWVDEVEYFKVDSVAPTTTKNITGCKYWDDSQQLYYVNCETNITFHPTDGGPVCAVGGVTTYYAWDDGNLTLYEGQVIKPLADGIHTLAYFSQDALGNIEQMQYEDDILDCAPPVIENIRPAYCEYTADETIEFTVTDPGVMPSGINLASIQVIVDGVADAGFSPQDDCTTTDGGLSYHCLFEAQNISENKTHIAVITASDNVCHSAEDVKRWTNWVNITLTHEDQLSVTCPTCKDACTDTGCPFLECSCAGLPETTDVWVDLIPPQQMCDGDTPYTVPDGTIVDLSMSIGGFYWPYTNLPTVNGQVHASTMPNPQAGVSQVTATTDGLVGESEIEYITCHVTGVWVLANPETLVANGTDTSQLTIQLVDDWGNAVALAGANIELGLDLEGTITPDTVTTDANGQVTATLTAGTQTGEATITAEIQGSSITDTTTVEFTEQTIEPFDDELAIAAEQWTLVSTPEPLNDSETGNVFPGDFVLLYNNSDESWIFPPATVDETFGYWVYSMDAETIPLVYNDDPLAVPPATSLGVGWNMIGHNLRQEMSIKDALLSIDGSYAYVLKYTGSGWDLYVAGADNTGPGRFNVMEPGVGYWVYMTQADNYAGLPG